jgi:hypothetical protein
MFRSYFTTIFRGSSAVLCAVTIPPADLRSLSLYYYTVCGRICGLHVSVFFHDHLLGILRCALCRYYSSRWIVFVESVLLHSMWPHVRKRFECAVGGVGGVRHPQHTQTGSNSSTIAADSSNSVTNIRRCRYSCMCSRWWVEVPPETCRAVSRYK